MIADADVLDDIATQWGVIRGLMRSGPSFQLPGYRVQMPRDDESFNLPLVLGYALLEQVLDTLRGQGVFSCTSWKLEKNMAASRDLLPWQDYATVDAGRVARNDLAHRAALIPKNQCHLYVNAIGNEFRAWGLIGGK